MLLVGTGLFAFKIDQRSDRRGKLAAHLIETAQQTELHAVLAGDILKGLTLTQADATLTVDQQGLMRNLPGFETHSVTAVITVKPVAFYEFNEFCSVCRAGGVTGSLEAFAHPL